jgi:glycosyltransferase involved in cell wall biosynthesis
VPEQADIAFFCDARSVHFKKWINALTERGYRLAVFSPWQDATSENQHHTFTTPKAPFPLPMFIKTFGKMVMRARNGKFIKRQLKKNPPKIVHAHFLQDSGWMAYQLNMHPFVVTIHGSDLLVLPNTSRIHSFIAKKVLQRCERVIIVGEHLRPKLRRFEIADDKVRYVPSFINTSLFYSAQREPRRERIVIGSARNFRPICDLQTLLNAVPLLLERESNFEIQLAGAGSQKELLQKLCIRLGIQERVKFLGVLEQKQVAEFFRSIDIYVSTAISDGVSVTLLEAVACGAFPIVTKIEGNILVFSHGVEGRLFESQNPADLAAKLLEVIAKGPQSISHMREKNSSIISNTFGRDAVVDKMEEVYREFL